MALCRALASRSRNVDGSLRCMPQEWMPSRALRFSRIAFVCLDWITQSNATMALASAAISISFRDPWPTGTAWPSAARVVGRWVFAMASLRSSSTRTAGTSGMLRSWLLASAAADRDLRNLLRSAGVTGTNSVPPPPRVSTPN
ncbi:hypothetical protein D3C72_1536940 [compost metagenome]